MNKYDKKFMEIANSLTELTDDPNIDLKLTEVIKTLKCQS